jgi:hypothetical protein
MSELREAVIGELTDHRAWLVNERMDCQCGWQAGHEVDWHSHVADAVLRVLAEHGDTQQLAIDSLTNELEAANADCRNQRRSAERAEADLTAARQQLDQVRATVLALPYGQTGGTKWLPDFEIGWLHCRQDVLAILDAPAQPAGHDETGQ